MIYNVNIFLHNFIFNFDKIFFLSYDIFPKRTSLDVDFGNHSLLKGTALSPSLDFHYKSKYKLKILKSHLFLKSVYKVLCIVVIRRKFKKVYLFK